MKKGAMSWLIGTCFVFLVLLGGYFVLVRLLPMGCKSNVVRSVPSPNGKIKAVVFQRDCGTSSAFNIHVSLLPMAASPGEDVGNIFVADTNNGQAPADRSGGPLLLVTWVTPTQLKIVSDHRDRTFKEVRQLNGVSVEFVAR